MTQILDGKATSLAIEAELTQAVDARAASGLKRPHLAAILVGDNPASRAYVGHKVKACANIGSVPTPAQSTVPRGAKFNTALDKFRML